MNMKKLVLPLFVAVALVSFLAVQPVLANMQALDEMEGGGGGGGGGTTNPPTTDDDNGYQVNEYEGGRTTMVYNYRNGVLCSISNLDNDTVQVFNRGNLDTILQDGEVIYQATYENGHLVSSIDNNGDTTYYNEYGQKEGTWGWGLNTLEDGTTEEVWVQETWYSYDSYGRLAWSESNVNNTNGTPEDLSDDFTERQRMTYNYTGNTLDSITVTDPDGNVLSEIEFTIDLNNGDKIATTYKTTDDGDRYMAKQTITSLSDGSKIDLMYSPEGKLTGYGTYDNHQRSVATYDVGADGKMGGGDDQITRVNRYDGAQLVESLSFEYTDGVIGLTTHLIYDAHGNVCEAYTDTFSPDDIPEGADQWNRYDPWTEGQLTIYDGQLAMIVDPEDVNGTEFYNFDPRTFGNCIPELDEDGNETGRFIVFISCEDPETYTALMQGAATGASVNLMWQYYASDADGNLHLYLASEDNADMGWAVQYHSEHDDWNQVNGASAADAGNLNQWYWTGG